MKKLILSAAILLSAVTGFAAPLDRSIREIRDIISSPELRRYIPPRETILDIRRIDRGYILTTNHYQIVVDVIYPLQGKQAGEESGTATLRFNKPTQTDS
jgi:hypothetical protein